MVFGFYNLCFWYFGQGRRNVPYLTWPAARVAINGFGLVFVGDEEDSLRFQSRTRGRRRMCNASGFRNLPPVTGPPHSKTIKSAPSIPNPGAQKPAASPYLPPIQAMASTHCHLTPRVICTWMPRICHPIASPARLYYKPGAAPKARHLVTTTANLLVAFAQLPPSIQ
jgi:hypothetical protein